MRETNLFHFPKTLDEVYLSDKGWDFPRDPEKSIPPPEQGDSEKGVLQFLQTQEVYNSVNSPM